MLLKTNSDESWARFIVLLCTENTVTPSYACNLSLEMEIVPSFYAVSTDPIPIVHE
jgi:hypothetical protein